MASEQTQREQVRALKQIASELHRNTITADELMQLHEHIVKVAKSAEELRATINELSERVALVENQIIHKAHSEE